MDAKTAATALRSGLKVRVTTSYGKVYEGKLDGHWIMAKTRYFGWDRYTATTLPTGEGVEVGREIWTLRFAVEGPGVPAGLESSIDATLDEMELVETTEDEAAIKPQAGLEVTFQARGDDTYDMQMTYPLGDGESGSEHSTLHRRRPAGVIKLSRAVIAKHGKIFQTGIIVVDGSGRSVAWPR